MFKCGVIIKFFLKVLCQPRERHPLSQHQRRSGLEALEVFAERATKHITLTPDLNSQTCSVATGALCFLTTEC